MFGQRGRVESGCQRGRAELVSDPLIMQNGSYERVQRLKTTQMHLWSASRGERDRECNNRFANILSLSAFFFALSDSLRARSHKRN